jgi:hypothetical protein
MGPFDPPGTTYIPGLTKNLYGLFTIDLGVFVEEVYECLNGKKAEKFVQDSKCCVRQRLGYVGPEKSDMWWKLEDNVMLEGDMRLRLERDALPFLDQFGSRDAILHEWKDLSRNMGFSNPPRIVCAIILFHRGEREQARHLLSLQAQESHNPSHPAYVRSLAERIGIPLDG